MPVYTHWDTWDVRPFEPSESRAARCSHRAGARVTKKIGRPRGVTDAAILDALRAFYATHGRSPHSREMRGMNHGVPSTCLLKLRFASVARAFALAGIPTHRRGGQVVHGRRRWVVPIDPVKAEQLTREKQAWWSRNERSELPLHGLTTWTHPYARRSA